MSRIYSFVANKMLTNKKHFNTNLNQNTNNVKCGVHSFCSEGEQMSLSYRMHVFLCY